MNSLTVMMRKRKRTPTVTTRTLKTNKQEKNVKKRKRSPTKNPKRIKKTTNIVILEKRETVVRSRPTQVKCQPQQEPQEVPQQEHQQEPQAVLQQGNPGGINMVAIFVPLSIFLLLLVLLVAVFLWRYSDRSQCLRRFRWKDGNTVKMKPGSDVITIYATASHPLDSGHPGQRPLSGHVYQEISDVHMGASGPGSSYSTLGFPFQDQKAAAQQPADGQYSLVGLPAK
ncbi:uncharacterized protein LOC120991961 isoform X6 [Bufo bufo]|uniref:uncharacterized protein LOC120991961 isoform X6 n=1 Tax=Bufo bufo TaxID=8384 RepID=UPI001ABE9784|nr:uncharacterized protein LOC120991961 isoform X6 [Bufo bufo]